MEPPRSNKTAHAARSSQPRRQTGGRRHTVENVDVSRTPESSSLPLDMNAMAMIVETECKADDGEGNTTTTTAKSTVPLFKKGMEVYYHNRSPTRGPMMSARILDVHYDDLLEPYYTILREDGVEKQTDNDHLVLVCPPLEPEEESLHDIVVRDDEPIVTETTGPLSPRPHLGNPQMDDGVPVTTLDELREKRKSCGLCPTCGDVQTHKPGLHRSWIPETVDRLVYDGACLKCNTLDEAKMKLGELIDGSDTVSRSSKSKIRNGASSQAKDKSTDRSSSHVTNAAYHIPISSRKGKHPPQSGISASCAIRPPREPSPSHRSNATEGAKESDQKITRKDFRRSKLTGVPTEPMTSEILLTHNTEPKDREEGNGGNEHHLVIAPRKYKCADNDSPKKSEDQRIIRKQTTLSTAYDSTLASSFTSSPSESQCLAKKSVADFRYGDSNGDFGFYTGTVVTLCAGTIDEKDAPHGRGEIVYDDGKIVEGVWSKDILKVKFPSGLDRYKPCLLPGYAIGDKGLRDDMVRGTVKSISKLHVNDCAFIRRSDTKKPWSYATVKSRSDGDDLSITFRINSRSSKTIGVAQWAGHVRLPVKYDILPGYAVGDPGRDEDMIIASSRKTVLSVSKLRIGDAAFLCRPKERWIYAIVSERTHEDDDAKITFKINHEGDTESIGISLCGRCVRRVKQQEHRCLSGEVVKIIPHSISKTKSSQRQNGRVAMNDVNIEEDLVKSSAPDGSSNIKHESPDAGQQQNPKNPSSHPREEPRDELDQKCMGSTGSGTYRSQSHQSYEMHEKISSGQMFEHRSNDGGTHDNSHNDAVNDKSLHADDTGSFVSDCSSLTGLTESNQPRSLGKDLVLLDRLARQRREATANPSKCAENSAEGGCVSSTDGSKRSSLKDQVLMGLLLQAAMEDIEDGDARGNVSVDESLTSMKESFDQWRKQEKLKKSRALKVEKGDE